MRKIFTFISLILLNCCQATAEQEQKFVNPLFYKTMEPVSTMAWRTKITPTSLVSDNKGTVLEQKCTLAENTMDTVTLDCEGAYEKEKRTLYRIVSQKRVSDGIFIVIYFKSPIEEEYISQDTYFIYDNPQ